MTTNAFTLLEMTGVDVAPYSARGLSQSLDPIDAAAQSRRTVNGKLKDLSFSGHKKFKSTISGTDQLAPAVNGVWPGKLVTVKCIAELCYLTIGGAADRDVVSGSSRVEGTFTYYRPELDMMVLGFTMTNDEYGCQVSWSMQLEEV